MLWISLKMPRTSRSRPVVGGGDPAETGTLVPPRRGDGVGLALYLVGAERGGRYPLPSAGTLTIGRGRDCEVVVDDPMASRRHARLHVGETLAIEDLGSANGITLAKERLPAGERRPLAVDEPFLIGALALVVRSAGLPYLSPQRLVTASSFLARVGRISQPFGLARIKSSRVVEPRWFEAILGGAMAKEDLFIAIQSGEAAIFHAGTDAAELEALMNACLAELASWEAPASGEMASFDPRATVNVGAAVGDFLRGGRVIELRRGSIVLSDPKMIDLHEVIRRVARTQVNVLILGETGVGKDVMASLLHELSPRRDRPFLKLNCATFSPALLESELFGHEKGAFTGAAAAKVGLLENADGGTVFLDELGEMPAEVQAKLLHTIETRQVLRIGSLKPRAIDVRFVAATNRDLEADTARGTFRSDLFYRLDTVQIRVPPLRERPSEVVPLAERFLEQARAQFGLGRMTFSPAALAAIKAHHWPGNVRQLRNAVERAALLGDRPALEPEDLDIPRAAGGPGRTPATVPAVAAPDPGASWSEARQADEKAQITAALEKTGGNQSQAAKVLGMPRRTLVRKLAQYGLRKGED
jgi:two-component system response regulator AtoC